MKDSLLRRLVGECDELDDLFERVGREYKIKHESRPEKFYLTTVTSKEDYMLVMIIDFSNGESRKYLRVYSCGETSDKDWKLYYFVKRSL